MSKNFNPRSREGSDAPPVCSPSSDQNFNPRSREGSDGVTLGSGIRTFAFQSTLPRRERRLCIRLSGQKYDFNPRSREGSDYTCNGHTSYTINFNPRSREGSDFAVCLFQNFEVLFQSTLPRRERHLLFR